MALKLKEKYFCLLNLKNLDIFFQNKGTLIAGKRKLACHAKSLPQNTVHLNARCVFISTTKESNLYKIVLMKLIN